MNTDKNARQDLENFVDRQKFKKTRDALTALVVVTVLLFVTVIAIGLGWAFTPVNALNAKKPNSKYEHISTSSATKRMDLADGVYTIESVNDHSFMGTCNNCYDAPSECASSAVGFVKYPTNLTITSRGVYKLIHDAETRKYLYCTDLNQICFTDSVNNEKTKWGFEIIQSINEKAAVVMIKNFWNQHYVRECSGTCPSSTGSFKLPIVDADRKNAISNGWGLFILRKQ